LIESTNYRFPKIAPKRRKSVKRNVRQTEKMNSNLIDKLKSWDGVHIEYLKKLYNSDNTNANFYENLVSICTTEKDLQKVSTWLIKHHYDNGHTLSNSETERLLTSCNTAENWEAKLHLLQLLPHFELTEKSIIIADDFVRNCLTDSNKFVRAWAYNGLYELTKYIPELRTELEFICQRAMEIESAAIKSKVKKILSALSKKKNE
jgi:hypothetical protein